LFGLFGKEKVYGNCSSLALLKKNVLRFRGRLEILQERKMMFVFFFKTSHNN